MLSGGVAAQSRDRGTPHLHLFLLPLARSDMRAVIVTLGIVRRRWCRRPALSESCRVSLRLSSWRWRGCGRGHSRSRLVARGTASLVCSGG